MREKMQYEKLVNLIFDKDKSLQEMDALAKEMIKEEYLTLGFWQALALEYIMNVDGEVNAAIFFFNPKLEYHNSFGIVSRYRELVRQNLDVAIFEIVAKANVGPGEDYARKAVELIQASENKSLLFSSAHRLSIALCLKANNLTRDEYDKIYAHLPQFSEWTKDSDVTHYELLAKVIEIYKLGYEQARSDMV